MKGYGGRLIRLPWIEAIDYEDNEACDGLQWSGLRLDAHDLSDGVPEEAGCRRRARYEYVLEGSDEAEYYCEFHAWLALDDPSENRRLRQWLDDDRQRTAADEKEREKERRRQVAARQRQDAIDRPNRTQAAINIAARTYVEEHPGCTTRKLAGGLMVALQFGSRRFAIAVLDHLSPGFVHPHAGPKGERTWFVGGACLSSRCPKKTEPEGQAS